MFGLFAVLRRLQTWLHQHVFKVGWLTTKDYQTTTILYYTLFLPGVVLHEVVYWLAAGLLNVRSENAIRWPEAQEIGELKLNFVKLSPRSSPLRAALIETAPLAAALAVVWYIANNVFELPQILDTLVPATLSSVNQALQMLVRTPDFWLWFYLAFTIGNTMLPDLPKLRGYRVIGIVIGFAAAVLVVLGLGSSVVLGVLGGPVATVLNVLSGIFAAIIGINVFMVAFLSAVENSIEWITGDSAEFQNGKMITMTREERMERRVREIEKQRSARQRRRAAAETGASGGPPSIYNRPLPLPGSPGEVSVTPIQKVLEDEGKTKKASLRSGRAGADLIPGRLEGDEERRLQGGGSSPQLAPGSTNGEES